MNDKNTKLTVGYVLGTIVGTCFWVCVAGGALALTVKFLITLALWLF